MYTQTPRTMRVRSLRRLQRRVDRTIASETSSSTRLGEITTLSLGVQRELSRLEDLPWPSNRALVTRPDARAFDRQILPLVRALRDERRAES